MQSPSAVGEVPLAGLVLAPALHSPRSGQIVLLRMFTVAAAMVAAGAPLRND